MFDSIPSPCGGTNRSWEQGRYPAGYLAFTLPCFTGLQGARKDRLSPQAPLHGFERLGDTNGRRYSMNVYYPKRPYTASSAWATSSP
jgi:hypothetical protein